MRGGDSARAGEGECRGGEEGAESDELERQKEGEMEEDEEEEEEEERAGRGRRGTEWGCDIAKQICISTQTHATKPAY